MGFAVPFGVSAGGDLVSPQDAAAHGLLRCPGCDGILVIATPAIGGVASLFVHRDVGTCEEDRMLRRAAKRMVAKTIRRAMGGPPIVIERICMACSQPWHWSWTPGPGKVAESVNDADGRLCDVVLKQAGDVVMIVDIHPYTSSGTERDPPPDVAWIELSRDDVLCMPGEWHPRRDSGAHQRCPSCVAKELPSVAQPVLEDRHAKIRRIALMTGQFVPDRESPYWAEPYRCYSELCATEMLVYTWVEHRWMQDERPPDPVPSTIWYRSSKLAGGKYWANTCPKCGLIQGEKYVYAPTGPLPQRFRGDG